MLRFLIVVVSLYSLMHAFFYFRVRMLLPEGRLSHFLLISFLALMIFAPIGARLFERGDQHTLARIAAHVGYPWMGFIFYAFCCFLVVVIAGLLLRLLNAAAGADLALPTGGKTAAAVLLIVLAINLYGLFEASRLRVERLTVRTAKLPGEIQRIRIAQISDIHLGLMVGEAKLKDILEKVVLEDPDILVSTGDLVDGDMDKQRGLPALFSRIRPRLGKWAITGNHEVYSGLSDSLKAEESFGFTMLRGEAKTVGGAINLVGVDDPAVGAPVNETQVLKKARNGLFTILLKHRPDPDRQSLGLFDLQLSGHTHYGQIFPFRLFSQIFYPLQNGPYLLENGSMMYTSRGTATWGPPIRVLAPPEITIIDIVRE